MATIMRKLGPSRGRGDASIGVERGTLPPRPIGPRPSQAAVPSAEEIVFYEAMAEYKRSSGRMFPTWSEVLEVLRGLGYEKQEPTRLPPVSDSHEPSKVCHIQLAVEVVEGSEQAREIEQLGLVGIVEAVGQALKHGVAQDASGAHVVELEEAGLSVCDSGPGQSNLTMSATIEVRFHEGSEAVGCPAEEAKES